MSWSFWFVLVCCGLCLIGCLFHVIRLIRLGRPLDYSPQAGPVAPSVIYSFTGAMHPLRKESAFLHLPTYTAGIVYHLGTFLSIPIFFTFLAQIALPMFILYTSSATLTFSVISGTTILFKRFLKKGLRELSNPDDYLSNLLVTLFQAMTALTCFISQLIPVYFVITGILLLYIPIGKLRHAIYFFSSRYHLGFFFGWRGVWPPKQI